MAEKTPRDQFDDFVPSGTRRGVHRAPARKGAGWIKFAWGALATGVLVVGGVGTMIVTSSSISLSDFESLFAGPAATASATPVPTAEPTVDPAAIVNVLNATGTTGVATVVGDELAAEGWTVGTRSNASQAVEETIVYYIAPTYEGAARGVVESLGYGSIKLSDNYVESSAQITIVVGQDYPAQSLP